ncbi:MAG: diadenosine tetraphosphate (Ap4A) HIT family hydrolase [Myxococcota bacterium]
MPWRITRDEALDQIAAEAPGGCLICGILSGRAGRVWVLQEGEHTVSILSRYPRNWGQAMVLMRRHTTTFSDVTAAEWQEACEEARRIAARVESELVPLRCYISSLGTWREDLSMSSPHLHIHIDPVYDPEDRPRTVFTHQHGVMAGEESEWMALQAILK